jgi:hypothetical protein
MFSEQNITFHLHRWKLMNNYFLIFWCGSEEAETIAKSRFCYLCMCVLELSFNSDLMNLWERFLCSTNEKDWLFIIIFHMLFDTLNFWRSWIFFFTRKFFIFPWKWVFNFNYQTFHFWMKNMFHELKYYF